MDLHRVDLPKKISGELLEQICIKAAEDLGYKAESKDEYSISYKLSSVHQHKEYDRTNIRIGNLFSAFQIHSIRKGDDQDYFFIWTGFPYGFVSEKKVQQYLSIVSKSLETV